MSVILQVSTIQGFPLRDIPLQNILSEVLQMYYMYIRSYSVYHQPTAQSNFRLFTIQILLHICPQTLYVALACLTACDMYISCTCNPVQSLGLTTQNKLAPALQSDP